MPEANRKREVGRGERVLPGVWRLRLPLPWPGVPHCNAWALAAGDGIVLVDTGMHEPGSMGHLERALAQVNLNLDLVRLLVCTHAHSDHYGQAATIVERTGCELWMHPNHDHMLSAARDPDAAFDRRIEVARQSGVPEDPLTRYAQTRRGQGYGIAGIVEPHRDLVPDVEVHTDLGTWQVFETPGHAPSHVCLYQEERRILLSGDHLLGRVSLYYDYGYSPDPAGEFLHSLDLVQELDARLCLSGHGRTFTDVQAHINANRTLVRDRLARVEAVIAAEPGLTAFDAIPKIYGAAITPMNANWWLSETLSYLRHLEHADRVHRVDDGPERWAAKT
ncbi:Hydroxyacylglutathione hydrolase [Baekduia alba]|uniref:MBL fold metallo-hydrolase n=1 Tax=Baekduia alba TaxID=2997333 RepID=UPI0023425278|nr:MBL fold metallo-hydrolase [Baekduia alba]WCB91977.1 Hydroxyacylglutathione hydrolase [Baekduia alba]